MSEFRYTYDQLTDHTGSLRTSGIPGFINSARRAFCTLASRYADWVAQFPYGEAVNYLPRQIILPAICPLPLPQVPDQSLPVPPGQGQCAGINYNISYRSRPSPSANWSAPSSTTARGALSFYHKRPKGGSPPAWSSGVTYSIGDTGRTPTDFDLYTAVGTNTYEFQILSVTRADGQPDTCAVIPTAPIPVPPPSQFTNVPVPVDRTPNLPITLPFTFAPTLYKVDVDVNLTFNVDLGGVNIKFDAGGVTINLPDVNINLPGGTRQLPPVDEQPTGTPPALPPAKPPVLNCPEVDLSGVISLLMDIKECACEEEGTIVQVAYTAARSRTIALPPKTKRVKLFLIDIPGNAKTEAGMNGPDVYYAGWTSFRFAGTNSLRNPIDYEEKVFICPEGANGFAFTCRTGYTASLLVEYEQA